MGTTRAIDDPWPRLAWIGPLAVLLALAALYAFLRLALEHPAQPPISRPVTVGVIELPAPAAPQPQPAAPPQAAPPPPPPEPVKPVEIAPPTPLPEPLPLPKRPPPRKPPPAKQAPAQRAPETPAPPSASAPAPAVAAPAPANNNPGPAGGNISARAIYQPMPEIPDELRHRNLELVAVARFRVGPDGKAEVELIQPTPEPVLNRALLERLKAWRFFPALASGKPVASVIDIRIPISVR